MMPWSICSSVVSSSPDFSDTLRSLTRSAAAVARNSAACRASESSDRSSRWNWIASTRSSSIVNIAAPTAPTAMNSAWRRQGPRNESSLTVTSTTSG